MAVYVIGIPLLITVPLLIGKFTGSFGTQEQPTQFRVRYGFFFIRYDDDYFFWELFVMLRKLIIVVCYHWLSTYTLLQASFAMIYMFFSIMIQDFAFPYKNDQADKLELALVLTAKFTMFLALQFHADELEADAGAVNDGKWSEEFWFRFVIVLQFCLLAFGVGVGQWFMVKEVLNSIKEAAAGKANDKWADLSAELKEVKAVVDKVLMKSTHTCVMDWMKVSTPDQQAYFKALLTSIEMTHEEMTSGEAQTFGDFLKGNYQILKSNFTFLFKFIITILKLVLCIGEAKKKAVKKTDEEKYLEGLSTYEAMKLQAKKSRKDQQDEAGMISALEERNNTPPKKLSMVQRVMQKREADSKGPEAEPAKDLTVKEKRAKRFRFLKSSISAEAQMIQRASQRASSISTETPAPIQEGEEIEEEADSSKETTGGRV